MPNLVTILIDKVLSKVDRAVCSLACRLRGYHVPCHVTFEHKGKRLEFDACIGCSEKPSEWALPAKTDIWEKKSKWSGNED